MHHHSEQRTAKALASSKFGWPQYDDFTDSSVYDVLGLGQAMTDFAVPVVEDSTLEQLQVSKGSRKIISLEERASILEFFDNANYSVTAGGSLSNSLMALARLGSADASTTGRQPLRVAMAGLVGGDPLGSFYIAQMSSAGVEFISPIDQSSHTGTVVVLTSPNAQRTMLSYLGAPNASLPLTEGLRAAIQKSRVVVIEGYLWELPDALETIKAAITCAKDAGVLVAMTIGDHGVAQRHGSDIWDAIATGVDIVFSNKEEADALLKAKDIAVSGNTAEACALALGPHCSIVSVTDGSSGSCITALGQLHVVPPHWVESPPVDTCGAGDAYAAGLLWALLRQSDVISMGRAGAKVASAVICKHGAALSSDAAQIVVSGFLTPSIQRKIFR